MVTRLVSLSLAGAIALTARSAGAGGGPEVWGGRGGGGGGIDRGSDEGWGEWAESYRRFLLAWAEVARIGEAEMLSVGVELRSWVTTGRVGSFFPIIDAVRDIYPG